MSPKSLNLVKKTWHFGIQRFFSYLNSSHGFLSMIFGILGNFGIGIGNPNKIWTKHFSSKKIRKLLVEKNFGTKNFRFLIEKFFVEKIDENSKCWDFENISKTNRNLKILKFHWFFQRKKCRSKIENFWSRKNFRPKVFGFFSAKIFSTIFFRITYFDPKWSQDSENHT